MYTAIQFPGLGGYVPGVLQRLATESQVSKLLAEVDRAARGYGVEPVSAALTDRDGPDIEELAVTPTRLHLASLVTGLVLYGEMVANGRPGDVLLGHSTGELTALAAAGALSVYDATCALGEREVALAEGDFAGGLTALRISARRADHLCGAVGGLWLRPSLFNAPQQTVVSGSVEELHRLEKAARSLGIQATRLLVAYPHHNPMLAGAARRVAEKTVHYRLDLPRIRVFSPLLGRLVQSVEDVRWIIDRHLTEPVRYMEALRALHGDLGVSAFFEAGPRPLLTQYAVECLPPGAELVGPPPGDPDGRDILEVLLSAGSADAAAPPFVRTSAPAAQQVRPVQAAAPASPAVPAPPVEPRSGLPERDRLVDELRRVFADALGYPEEVFTEDAHLEADLGIASVKKTDLLVELLDRYDLPTPPAELRLRDYNTLPKLADLMVLLAAEEADGPVGVMA